VSKQIIRDIQIFDAYTIEEVQEKYYPTFSTTQLSKMINNAQAGYDEEHRIKIDAQ
jgi:hypothetical protein